MSEVQTKPGTEGRYLKTCRGCKREFRTDARNARYGPAGFCKCLERRKAAREKRAKERRQYHRDPETFKALSRTRAQARKLVLAHYGITFKSKQLQIDKTKLNRGGLEHGLGCNSPGCSVNLFVELRRELDKRRARNMSNRGAIHAAVKSLLKKLEAHHRDHNPFNNTFESYPTRSNIELLCRRHHEQADRAKTGHAALIVWSEPKESWFDYLVRIYRDDRRNFYLVPVAEHYRRWLTQ